MHSHDRTLLAQLGFQDRDRAEPAHDLACQYIAEREQRLAIANIAVAQAVGVPGTRRYGLRSEFRLPPLNVPEKWGTYSGEETILERRVSLKQPAQLEMAIEKGEGKYKTTVGFADVYFEAILESHAVGRYIEYQSPTPFDRWNNDSIAFLLEVKANPVPASAILRQLNLYCSYLLSSPGPDGGPRTLAGVFAAVLWDMPRSDVAMLREQGVEVLRLGAKFEAWLEAQAAPPDGPVAPVEEI